MNSRRNFITTAGLLGAAAAINPLQVKSAPFEKKLWKGRRHWVWTNPDVKDTEDQLAERYHNYHQAGVRGIFFENDSEKHFRAAKAQKLEAHRWMWTMNRGEKTLLEAHPEWYAESRTGNKCSIKPPYVDYYRWLCPSRTEVQQYLADQVNSILEKDYVDGIHLDYVRFCDVILPVNLWSNYHIEQTRELPEYDFCYCEVCRSGFKSWRGTDLNDIAYPEASLSWRQYRYNAITNVVNRLSDVAAAHQKKITAAVFPTPEVARRNVRQDWTNWKLDGVCPMIYHGFYKEKVDWIGDAVAEGIHFLNGRFPLYAGLYLPDFKSDEELYKGIQLALTHGASGISLFGTPSADVLKILKQASDAV